jgi:hypothetical protein
MKTFLHSAQVEPLFVLIQVPLYNNPEALAVMNRKLRYLKKKVRTKWIKEVMFEHSTYEIANKLLQGYPAHRGRLPLYFLIAFFLAPEDHILVMDDNSSSSDDDSYADDEDDSNNNSSNESGYEE